MSYLKSKDGSIEASIKEMQKNLKDNAYQQMFKKELEKAGKGIGSMSPKEKKAFFNKIDSKYTAKDEGLETMVPVKKDDKESQKDKARTSTMTGEKPTKIDTKPEVNYK